jgi:hypothetical protein
MTASLVLRAVKVCIAYVAGALLAPSVAAAQTPQPVPYYNTFETSVSTGWSLARFTSTAQLSRFMGDFGLNGSTQDETTLALTTAAGKSYTLIFDLYGLRSPDGSNTSWGPDYFNVLVDGVTVFRETIGGSTYSYPLGTDASGSLGVGAGDCVFRAVTLTFVPAGATCRIRFLGGLNQSRGDEAWGIDNVRVVETTDAAQYAPKFGDVSRGRTFQVTATTVAADAAGVAWSDVNNDGYLDGILSGRTARQFIYSPVSKRFTASTLVGSGYFYRQAAVGDLDNDGDTDFFGMSGDATGVCLLGQGTGTFVNAGALGFTSPSTIENAVAADVNADGWLDMLMFAGNGNAQATNGGATRWPGIVGFGGSGTAGVPFAAPFASVTTPAGLNSVGAAGDGVYVASADLNDDDVPDFWYGFGGGRLFVSSPTGYVASTAISGDVSNTNKVGAAFGDFDNDGKVDLFVPAYTVGQRGKLYRGLGDGTFVDVSIASGISNTGGQRSCCWGDYDNDGDLDLYIVGLNAVGNSLYRNEGNGAFTLVDERCRSAGTDSMDACFGDYDNDGDLDLAVSVNNRNSTLYDNAMNVLSPTKRYLKVRFVGKGAGATNQQGVGQRVLLLDSTGKVIARRDLGGARGIGTEPVIAHFGGVDPTKKYFVKVFSKGKGYTTVVTPGTVTTKIGANTFSQMLTITEADLKPPLRITSWTEDPG